MRRRSLFLSAACLALPVAAQADEVDFDPVDLAAAEERAAAIVAGMSDEQKTILTYGLGMFPDPNRTTQLPEGALYGAGFIAGIADLGIPAMPETDGPVGVSYIGGARGDFATPFPSTVALGATFNPEIAYLGGEAMGAQARALGFSIMLAGGANLTREPRNGRTFEYVSEDPLLTGVLVGGQVAGIQSNNIISTVKHFALNGQETGRAFVDVLIDDASARESDLLAFQLAIELGQPGSIMCAYNLVNSEKACGSHYLLTQVLKEDWDYPGFVMSDWGAVDSVDFAWAGLDQQSGAQIDPDIFLDDTLLAEAGDDEARLARIDDMNKRVLTAMIATGLLEDQEQAAPINFATASEIALEQARQSIVLLKNDNSILPLSGSASHIAVIGGRADFGVPSGGGSSQVHGEGGAALTVRHDPSPFGMLVSEQYHGPSPLTAIEQRAGDTKVNFRDGRYVTDAVIQARQADVVIVFANQWMTEGFDVPDLSLPGGQDALISAVAAANPNTIVVLQTGGPVDMPWLDDVAGVVQAWYGGEGGAQAIAEVLFGDVNPSGHLPLTFPRNVTQLPRPEIPGAQTIEPGFLARSDETISIDYTIEGSDVGYRWFAANGESPLFPFGYGQSYTQFSYDGFALHRSDIEGLGAVFQITNSGERSGADVAQIYLTAVNGEVRRRLVGFARLDLEAGETETVRLYFDPRLLAEWNGQTWEMAGGRYDFALSADAQSDLLTASVDLENLILDQKGQKQQ